MRFDHVAQQVGSIDEAMRWWQETVADSTVLYQDETWGMLDAAGARIAFVVAAEHPAHVAYRVTGTELEQLAGRHGAAIARHRDGSRSCYVQGPGDQVVEFIAYE